GRGVQDGDVAVLNIKLEGEEGDGRNFMTVAGQTFPQLDQAIMGMNPEEMKVLDLTFPENFQEKDWAGKPYRCQITVRNLSSIKLPELDDEFSKSYNLDNIEDLRKRLREHIGFAKQEAVQEHVNEQILDQVLQRSTIHVPDTMWEQVATDKLQQMAEEQKQQDKTLEQYADENGMTVEKLVEAVQQEAKTYVLRAQIINEIFIREKMALSNTELNQELLIMSRANNMEPQELLNLLQKNNQVQEIHYAAVNRKVMDFLNSKARMKEPVTA
ncbi:MAG TPA: hypothetical protein VEX38_02045, partial [Fimbriimonadaceae bacterium]|nr:hypothetical protein [Fimbriimonadaceae bacterium]